MDSLIDKFKNSFRSCTIWFNSIIGALIGGIPLFKDSLPEMQQYVPPKIYMYLAIALFIGNIALRFKTDRDLRDK